MKQTRNRLKRQTYQPPKALVIEIEPQSVMCGSGIRGNSTESVGVSEFGWF